MKLFVGVGLFVVVLGLSACGSPTLSPTTHPASPSPTLTQAQLQSAFNAAGNAYNAAESTTSTVEGASCSSLGLVGDLTKCQAAIKNDLQATQAYDAAIKQISFPAADQADVTTLLNDDTKLEAALAQEEAATSLSAISSLVSQSNQLSATTTQDVTKLGDDIGLSGTVPTPTASSTTAAQGLGDTTVNPDTTGIVCEFAGFDSAHAAVRTYITVTGNSADSAPLCARFTTANQYSPVTTLNRKVGGASCFITSGTATLRVYKAPAGTAAEVTFVCNSLLSPAA